jgi:hypothetical protein
VAEGSATMTVRRRGRGVVVRVWCYVWAAPASLVGLALALLVGARLRIVDGVAEAHGSRLAWALRHLVPIDGGAAALTLGHVVLARDESALVRTRRHERAHVRQFERWGAGFFPAYAAASLWAALRGGHYYFDNRFESAARAAERIVRAS